MTEIGDEGLLAPASRSEQGEGVARLRKSAARKSPSIIASAELQEPAEDKMVSIPKLDALDPSMALKKIKKKEREKGMLIYGVCITGNFFPINLFKNYGV